MGTTAELRKRARVLEWKRATNAPDFELLRNFREAGVIRQERKEEVIQKFLASHIQKRQILPVTVGATTVFQYRVLNNFPDEECFAVRIEGNEEGELQLVTGPSEL
jgi:hypothetical protein